MPTYVLETPTFAPNGHDSGSPPVFLILLGSELQACNRDRRVLCALCAPILFFALRCSGAVLIYSVFRAFLPVRRYTAELGEMDALAKAYKRTGESEQHYARKV